MGSTLNGIKFCEFFSIPTFCIATFSGALVGVVSTDGPWTPAEIKKAQHHVGYCRRPEK